MSLNDPWDVNVHFNITTSEKKVPNYNPSFAAARPQPGNARDNTCNSTPGRNSLVLPSP
jgi:hypothetical protein